MLLMAVLTTGLAAYFGVQLYTDINYLNGKTPELLNLSSYDTRTLQANFITQPIVKNAQTVKDLLDENLTTQ